MARPARRYYIGLARRLGMTTAELLARISSEELSEQMAYDQLEAQELAEAERERGLVERAMTGLRRGRRG